MFCRECGKKVEEGNKFCTGCGAKIEPIKVQKVKVQEEGKENINENDNLSNNANTNNTVNDNHTSNNVIYKENKEDKFSVGFNILSFFIPLVGLILFLVYRKESPKKAKGIGICALIGYILVTILSIIFIILLNLFIYNYGFDDRFEHHYRYNDYDRYYRYDYKYNI